MDEQTRSLIQGSLEKARGKLKVAAELFKARHYDDAISRAYYAVFHAAQAVLLTEGLSAETHRGLVNLFGLHLVKTGKIDKKFGKYLSNLKDDRENSDYEIFSMLDEESASSAVKEAREFLHEIERYLTKLMS